ncbi:hypothetical protein Ae201684P_013941 [Aphanomyces euteiches]|uniref:Uncharacterized protein n=1 Tax=Aphanomyces euteiches TaxID=100861 RepID=A0A6G0WLS1_9STRA|nr:hypothetical protein Ae201684_013887 [Aphanomyces euteiches]KAH9083040.1 hypothetical protein Ae201684P_013941 [Aphanomyces euteiches]
MARAILVLQESVLWFPSAGWVSRGGIFVSFHLEVEKFVVVREWIVVVVEHINKRSIRRSRERSSVVVPAVFMIAVVELHHAVKTFVQWNIVARGINRTKQSPTRDDASDGRGIIALDLAAKVPLGLRHHEMRWKLRGFLSHAATDRLQVVE